MIASFLKAIHVFIPENQSLLMKKECLEKSVAKKKASIEGGDGCLFLIDEAAIEPDLHGQRSALMRRGIKVRTLAGIQQELSCDCYRSGGKTGRLHGLSVTGSDHAQMVGPVPTTTKRT